jgi:cytochrome c oxidase subunit 2
MNGLNNYYNSLKIALFNLVEKIKFSTYCYKLAFVSMWSISPSAIRTQSILKCDYKDDDCCCGGNCCCEECVWTPEDPFNPKGLKDINYMENSNIMIELYNNPIWIIAILGLIGLILILLLLKLGKSESIVKNRKSSKSSSKYQGWWFFWWWKSKPQESSSAPASGIGPSRTSTPASAPTNQKELNERWSFWWWKSNSKPKESYPLAEPKNEEERIERLGLVNEKVIKHLNEIMDKRPRRWINDQDIPDIQKYANNLLTEHGIINERRYEHIIPSLVKGFRVLNAPDLQAKYNEIDSSLGILKTKRHIIPNINYKPETGEMRLEIEFAPPITTSIGSDPRIAINRLRAQDTNTPAISTSNTPEVATSNTPETSNTNIPEVSNSNTSEASNSSTPVVSTSSTPEASNTNTPETSDNKSIVSSDTNVNNFTRISEEAICYKEFVENYMNKSMTLETYNTPILNNTMIIMGVIIALIFLLKLLNSNDEGRIKKSKKNNKNIKIGSNSSKYIAGCGFSKTADPTPPVQRGTFAPRKPFTDNKDRLLGYDEQLRLEEVNIKGIELSSKIGRRADINTEMRPPRMDYNKDLECWELSIRYWNFNRTKNVFYMRDEKDVKIIDKFLEKLPLKTGANYYKLEGNSAYCVSRRNDSNVWGKSDSNVGVKSEIESSVNKSVKYNEETINSFRLNDNINNIIDSSTMLSQTFYNPILNYIIIVFGAIFGLVLILKLLKSNDNKFGFAFITIVPGRGIYGIGDMPDNIVDPAKIAVEIGEGLLFILNHAWFKFFMDYCGIVGLVVLWHVCTSIDVHIFFWRIQAELYIYFKNKKKIFKKKCRKIGRKIERKIGTMSSTVTEVFTDLWFINRENSWVKSHKRSDVPLAWGLYFQDGASPSVEGIVDLHNRIMFYLVVILFGVTSVMISIMWNFNKGNNKLVYRYLNHGTLIELIWTVGPALVLVAIAFPSFKLLYLMDEVIDPAMTVKITGHQWYWEYEYADFLNEENETINFDSYMKDEASLENGELRMLEVDNPVILPVDTHVRFIITGADVLHDWAVPSLGIKVDATPGRLNQVSVIIERTGFFYGQCSEICGVLHSSMPIKIEAVEVEKFFSWLLEQ